MPFDEKAFQQWYANAAKKYDLNPNPEGQSYDYRAAFKAGALPDSSGHWPSDFKDKNHPNYIVGGYNTTTGEPHPGAKLAQSVDELVRLGWDKESATKLHGKSRPKMPKSLKEIVAAMKEAGESADDINGVVKEYETKYPATHKAIVNSEPSTKLGGIAKSVFSGEALKTGLQGAKGFAKGAVLDLPSSIWEGVKGAAGLVTNPMETIGAMASGLKDMPGQMYDSAMQSGSHPEEFGRMMGQMTGQPLLGAGLSKIPKAPIVRGAGKVLSGTGKHLADGGITGWMPPLTTPRKFKMMEKGAGKAMQYVGNKMASFNNKPIPDIPPGGPIVTDMGNVVPEGQPILRGRQSSEVPYNANEAMVTPINDIRPPVPNVAAKIDPNIEPTSYGEPPDVINPSILSTADVPESTFVPPVGNVPKGRFRMNSDGTYTNLETGEVGSPNLGSMTDDVSVDVPPSEIFNPEPSVTPRFGIRRDVSRKPEPIDRSNPYYTGNAAELKRLDELTDKGTNGTLTADELAEAQILNKKVRSVRSDSEINPPVAEDVIPPKTDPLPPVEKSRMELLREKSRKGIISPAEMEEAGFTPKSTPASKDYTIDNAPPNRRAKIHRGAHDPVDVLFGDEFSRQVFGAGQKLGNKANSSQIMGNFQSAATRIADDFKISAQQARELVLDYNAEVRRLSKDMPKHGEKIGDLNFKAPTIKEFFESRKESKGFSGKRQADVAHDTNVKPTATYLGMQENLPGEPAFPLYNIVGGPRNRSTVTASELREMGIDIPDHKLKSNHDIVGVDEGPQELFGGSKLTSMADDFSPGPKGETGRTLVRNMQRETKSIFAGDSPTEAGIREMIAKDDTGIIKDKIIPHRLNNLAETLEDKAKWGRKNFPANNVEGQRAELETTAKHFEDLAKEIRTSKEDPVTLLYKMRKILEQSADEYKTE